MHVFPGGKRKAYPEELSEEPEILPIEAFLIGPDASYTKYLLITACKKRDPGKLYHPQVGYILAKCKSFRVREVFHRVGKIYLSMEFVEVEEEIKRNDTTSNILSFIKDIDDLINEKSLALVEALSVINLPAFAIAKTSQALNMISNIIKSDNGLGRIGGATKETEEALKSLTDEGEKLISSPVKLINTFDKVDVLGINIDDLTAIKLSTKSPKEVSISEKNAHRARNIIVSYFISLVFLKQLRLLIDDYNKGNNDSELLQIHFLKNQDKSLVPLVCKIKSQFPSVEIKSLHQEIYLPL